jgi:hypothetical protein
MMSRFNMGAYRLELLGASQSWFCLDRVLPVPYRQNKSSVSLRLGVAYYGAIFKIFRLQCHLSPESWWPNCRAWSADIHLGCGVPEASVMALRITHLLHIPGWLCCGYRPWEAPRRGPPEGVSWKNVWGWGCIMRGFPKVPMICSISKLVILWSFYRDFPPWAITTPTPACVALVSPPCAIGPGRPLIHDSCNKWTRALVRIYFAHTSSVCRYSAGRNVANALSILAPLSILSALSIL